MGIILFLFASVLEIILGTIFILLTAIWYLFTFKWQSGWRKIDLYFMNLALAKDQYGNVFLKEPMNRWLAKGSGQYFYGDADDTISYVTAMNYFKGKRTGFGKFLGESLNKVDKSHMEKSINSKMQKDIEGYLRLRSSGMIDSYGIANKVIPESYKKYVAHVQNRES